MTAVDPSGNVAVVESTAAYQLSRIGVALASGLAGYAFGYTCGYLDAVVTQGLEGDAAEFHAKREGLLVGSIDFAASITLGARGRVRLPIGPRLIGTSLFLTGAYALSSQASLVTNQGGGNNQAGQFINTICMIISAVGGFATGKAIDGLFGDFFAPSASRLIAPNIFTARIPKLADEGIDGIDAVVDSRAFRAQLAGSPLARRLYQRMDELGVDVVIHHSGDVPPGFLGEVIDNGSGWPQISIYLSNHGLANNALQTFVHETRHVDDLLRGRMRLGHGTTMWDEFRAIRREEVLRHGRKLKLSEQRAILGDLFAAVQLGLPEGTKRVRQ